LDIIWLPAADRTRDAQIAYISLHNSAAAARLDSEIERQVDMLVAHPLMGRLGRRAGTR